MGNTWIIDLNHFLDEEGAIAPPKGPGRRLAEHFVSIVSMITHPGIIHPPEYQVRCRRRPGRKPCPGVIEADIDPETEDIIWWCPICDDNGYIRNWKGTMWDISDMEEVQ